MLPIRDINPSERYPVVNNTLIGVCVVVFLLQVTHSAGMVRFILQYGLVPADPRMSAFFTSMFLHGGIWHLFFNMWFLYIFGDNIEDRLGPFRYLVFYVSCGLISALAHFFLTTHPELPVVGASGAIAGVMGAYFILFPTARVLTLVPLLFIPLFFEIPAFIFLGFWFVMQLMSAAGSVGAGFTGVAWWAHVGGFISGVVLIRILGGGLPRRQSNGSSRKGLKKKSPRVQVVRPGSGEDDFHLSGTINITGPEGLTGTVKTVNIPKGFRSRFYRVKVPPGTRPGATLRLQGLGRQRPDGTRGNVFLKVVSQ